MGFWKKAVSGVSAASICGMGYIAYDVKRHKVYSDQTFAEAAKHYFTVRSLYVMGKIMARKLEAATKDIKTAQKEFLMQQLKENKDTQFFKDMQLNQVQSIEDFRQLFPLTDYTYYSRYISRMMSGEKNVLSSQPPIIFAVTSGTSGDSKVIPMLMKQTKLFFLEGISVLFKYMVDTYPQTKLLSKDLKLFFSPNWRYTVDEVPVGPNSASPDRSHNLLHIYTTPMPAYDVKSEPEALYLYLLFALLDPHVGMIEANFASIVYNAFCTLDAQLVQLATDIKQGVINHDLKIDPAVREQLQDLLKPNPVRAKELLEAAEKGKVGLARRIWPELQVVLAADTGTFDLYAEKLRNEFCKDVPLYSPIYAASEGLLGINIWPNQLPSRYLLHPRAQFFEFIPEDIMDEENPDAFLMHEVKDGMTYELVITNPSCLYRYRFGDVVKVVGFHNQCPIIEFKYRKGQFLNIRGEKVSEQLFYDVLKSSVSKMWSNCTLADYCCIESVVLDGIDIHQDFKSKQPCYHVFVELEKEDGSGDQMLTSNYQNTLLDDALKTHSYPYCSFRQKGSIGLIQVHLVPKGSFQSLRLYMLEKPTATSNQYKIPRVLRNPGAVKFMLDKAVSFKK
ncbi:GH3 domain-containing protein-like [Biomphalaria glabrata]|uniref:GH3 domain-containing protein-like n=1 Tax=Biomphalaria glabrata TaxID=6526 RepID=A0A9W3B2L0_BIOGL|nr:GH3 domain-containing protein-like [Biomphalaria glabrata]